MFWDIKKYFDSFDHDFVLEMMKHVGMPAELAKLTHHLCKNMKRVLTKGKSLSQQLRLAILCGAAQVRLPTSVERTLMEM